jgi:hypothetical protein
VCVRARACVCVRACVRACVAKNRDIGAGASDSALAHGSAQTDVCGRAHLTCEHDHLCNDELGNTACVGVRRVEHWDALFRCVGQVRRVRSDAKAPDANEVRGLRQTPRGQQKRVRESASKRRKQVRSSVELSGCRTHAPTVKHLEDTVAGSRHGDSVAKAQSVFGQGNTWETRMCSTSRHMSSRVVMLACYDECRWHSGHPLANSQWLALTAMTTPANANNAQCDTNIRVDKDDWV